MCLQIKNILSIGVCRENYLLNQFFELLFNQNLLEFIFIYIF
jgi:hypothetical protein